MKEKEGLRTLPAVISLSAALVVSIVMLVNKKSSLSSLLAVLGFLIGFYIVGMIFRKILLILATREEPEAENENEPEDTEKTNLESDTE